MAEELKYKDEPDQDGWYWVKYESGLKDIKQVFTDYNKVMCTTVVGLDGWGSRVVPVGDVRKCEWAGPIQEPVDEVPKAQTLKYGSRVLVSVPGMVVGKDLTFGESLKYEISFDNGGRGIFLIDSLKEVK